MLMLLVCESKKEHKKHMTKYDLYAEEFTRVYNTGLVGE